VGCYDSVLNMAVITWDIMQALLPPTHGVVTVADGNASSNSS